MLFIMIPSFIFSFLALVLLTGPESADSSIRCDEELLHLNHPSGAMNEITHQILSIPAYWINLASSVERKRYMRQMLTLRSPSLGIGHHKRIEAVTPGSPNFNLSMLEKPCKRNTPNDLAIIMSHLTAMRTAVYDQHSRWEKANMGDSGR